MVVSAENIGNELRELMGLFRAESFDAAVAKSESVIKQIESASVPPPPGLYGLYALSLYYVGNIEGSVKAFTQEKKAHPDSTIGEPVFSLAKQIHATRISGRATYLKNYSDTPEGKILGQKIWELMRAPLYKKRVADFFMQIGRDARRYTESANHQEPWIDLFVAAEWVIDFYKPYRILVVGDETSDLESYIKTSSPYSSVHQIAGEHLLRDVTEHLTAQDYKNRFIDLILITEMSSKKDRVELLYRAMPYLAPSGFLVASDMENGNTIQERESFKVESLDSIFGETEEGYFFTARSPQILLLSQVG